MGTTDLPAPAPDAPARRGRLRASGPDRVSVMLVSVAAFLVVLALLAAQLRAAPAHQPGHRVIVLRRVYQTTVIETVPGSGSGTSVSQSVSSSGAGYSSSAPVTRSSG